MPRGATGSPRHVAITTADIVDRFGFMLLMRRLYCNLKILRHIAACQLLHQVTLDVALVDTSMKHPYLTDGDAIFICLEQFNSWVLKVKQKIEVNISDHVNTQTDVAYITATATTEIKLYPAFFFFFFFGGGGAQCIWVNEAEWCVYTLYIRKAGHFCFRHWLVA